MKLKVFTLRMDPDTGTFDDAPVTAFLAEREALAVSDHFFVHEERPTWALLVSYRDGAGPPARGQRGPAPPEPDAVVPEADKAVFEALRRWRNDRAKRDGRPPYVLLTNRQLAAIAALRPATRTALETVDGVGSGRAAALAEDVLAVVQAAATAERAP